jgi:CRP/FNR family transcriptional regulator, cyclic AMP receptor protein
VEFDRFLQLFIFSRLEPREVHRLKSICHLAHYAEGDYVVKDNTPGSALYIVRKGVVRVEKDEQVLAHLGEGEFFGEMALIDDCVSSADVIADTDCDLLIFHKGEFGALLETDHELALKVYKAFCSVLAERLRATSLIYSISLGEALGPPRSLRSDFGQKP